MTKSKKTVAIVLIVFGAAIALAAVGLGGWGISFYFRTGGNDRLDGKTIRFDSDVIFLRGDAITAPASGSTRRSIRAKVYDGEQNALAEGQSDVVYEMSKEIEGVYLDGDMLVVTSDLKRSESFTVTARDRTSRDGKLYATKKVKVVKDGDLRDVPRSPLEKEGYMLYFNDDFDKDELNYNVWSPYYLRHWVEGDDRTKCDYRFERNGGDGALVISASQDRLPWSSQDGKVKVSGITSYETDYLHKFGATGSGAVFNKDVPTFDGLATKYGYFELRMRMPDTKDGSHFAWWMIGVQDDMNESAMLEGDDVPMQSHYSNETGEFDIIETTLTSLDGMKAWRPVIHPNGTTDYRYQWVEAAQIPGNPMLEYHNYGFEWDETGTKFYVDGVCVNESDRTPNYRMMTFLTLYATGGLGEDRGIYPKEAYIDYFRIYKKTDTVDRATSVRMDKTAVPDYVRVPEIGENPTQIQLRADVLDGFDRVIDGGNLKWRLSATIDGFTPTVSAEVMLRGATLRADGLLTIDATARDGQDVFVTAYLDDAVKQTFHVKLSRDTRRDLKIAIGVNGSAPRQNKTTLKKGETLDLSARLLDQYLVGRADVAPIFRLSEDLTGNRVKEYDGVTLIDRRDGTASLAIAADSALERGDVIVVALYGGAKRGCLFVTVE